MLSKLIADISSRKLIQSYYPSPYFISQEIPEKYELTFTVWLNDSLVKPSASNPFSATGIKFTFKFVTMTINIDNINVYFHKRKTGLSRTLLEPLWKIYSDLGFQEVSLLALNPSFWTRIQNDYPEINFKIREAYQAQLFTELFALNR